MALDLPETTLAERIRKGRLAIGLSQAGLARALGVKSPSVHAWETGETRPEVDTLLAMAELFTKESGELVTVDWLLGRKAVA